ncbi:DNA polymerase III subunit gamma/tau [Chitinophagaceae bacterium LWZ2-11]
MDKFIVSARKYRPQNFNTVVGQSHITTTLKNAIKNNQLAHAFLFCGPRGVGKTTCARILAKTINCIDKTPEGEACNVCSSCVSFDAGTSLNIHELDAASNNSVDDIRSLVEQVRFAPQAGKYKVYIVDEVHMLSTSAFNAFLKTLEEPPPYAIFILATTEKHKILPTILSRCQIFDFKRITTNDTVEHLQEIIDKEEIKADKASLQIIAQKSEGCMRDALSILDKIVSFTNGEVTYQNTLENLNILDHDYYFRLLDCLLAQDMAGALLLYDEINRKGFEGDLVLNGFAEFIRNILVCKDAKAAMLLDVVEGMQAKYSAAANKINIGFLVSSLNILNEAEINFKMARNKRLHVELVLIKLNFLQQALELSIENGSVVKKKRIDGAVAVKYKQVPGIQLKTVPQTQATPESKLYIEQPKSNGSNQPAQTAQPIQQPQTQTKPQAKAAAPASATQQSPKPVQAAPAGKKSLLDSLRERYGDRYSIHEVKEALPLDMESLKNHWKTFVDQLRQQQKHSQSNAFHLAELNIVEDNLFTVTVNSTLQQRFIEQEKIMMVDYLQQQYNNRTITFSFIMQQTVKEEVPQHVVMTHRQKYERIAEQYPWVRELRDRLKLDLD